MKPLLQSFFAAFLFPVFFSPLFTAAAQDKTAEQPVRIETAIVSVPVIVSDRQGRYVSGLRQSDFTLSDNKVRQQIAFFAAAEEPFNVALILDTSRSTRTVLDDIRHAAKDFIKNLRPQDRAMIVTADYEIRALSALTSDRKTLEKAIESARVGDYTGTVLRDAISDVLEHDFKTLRGRKAIIVLTDGKDYGSQISEDDLLDDVEEADTLIYPVFYFTMLAQNAYNPPPRAPRGGWGGVRIGRRGAVIRPFPRLPRPDVEARRREREARRRARIEQRRERAEQRNARAIDFLEELAEHSAGRFYRSDLTNLKKTFGLIADELRHQYRLGFYPDDAQPADSFHTLKVEVARPDVVVRARRSYRTPTPESPVRK
ncbi:MAG: VWA domain-containing protein [Blastocatellia bacterium]